MSKPKTYTVVHNIYKIKMLYYHGRKGTDLTSNSSLTQGSPRYIYSLILS